MGNLLTRSSGDVKYTDNEIRNNINRIFGNMNGGGIKFDSDTVDTLNWTGQKYNAGRFTDSIDTLDSEMTQEGGVNYTYHQYDIRNMMGGDRIMDTDSGLLNELKMHLGQSGGDRPINSSDIPNMDQLNVVALQNGGNRAINSDDVPGMSVLKDALVQQRNGQLDSPVTAAPPAAPRLVLPMVGGYKDISDDSDDSDIIDDSSISDSEVLDSSELRELDDASMVVSQDLGSLSGDLSGNLSGGSGGSGESDDYIISVTESGSVDSYNNTSNVASSSNLSTIPFSSNEVNSNYSYPSTRSRV